MFAQYETELGEVLGEIATKLAALDAGTSSPLHATAAVGEVEDLLRAASDLSKQLDVEVRSAAPNAKRTFQERQAPLKQRLKDARAAFENAKERANREAVLGTGVGDASASSRGRLVDAQTRASRQTDMIKGALEIAHETEQVAVDITSELDRNRETITNIRGHIADTGGSLGAARGLIASMQKREVQQKVVLSVVAAILIGAVGAVSYYSF